MARGRSEARAWLRAVKQLRRGDLARYARTDPDGRPRFCTAPLKVREDRARRGLKPLRRKVIFNSVDDAENYAKVILNWEGTRSRAYECPFSKHGHAHLTSHIKEEETND